MLDYKAVLSYYPAAVPRYTSYPTAPHFSQCLGINVFNNLLDNLSEDEPVSIYIHIPYCDKLCWFCGCNTKHTLKYAPVARYMNYLIREIELFGQKLDFKPKIQQIHLGGGSPSLLKSDDFTRLRIALDEVFHFLPNSEVSVEIDPSDVSEDMLMGVREFGVTRASIGVQDFHADVQSAINRPQSFELTRDVVTSLREIGIKSINIDALYGLPRQSYARLMDTISKCISLAPDRMALFGYAHVPWVKKHQNMISLDDLPDNHARFEHSMAASRALVGAGYVGIGIDHFAKPDDSLAIAARSGRIHRNFQGYTTDECKTLIALGGSSIGRTENGFYQNVVATSSYEDMIEAGKIAASKGLLLSDDDKIRSHIIERIMCDFQIDFKQLGRFPSSIDIYRDIAMNFIAEDPFNLAFMHDDVFEIKNDGKPFTRIIASQFDAYLKGADFKYSKAV